MSKKDIEMHWFIIFQFYLNIQQIHAKWNNEFTQKSLVCEDVYWTNYNDVLYLFLHLYH